MPRIQAIVQKPSSSMISIYQRAKINSGILIANHAMLDGKLPLTIILGEPHEKECFGFYGRT
ncbi:MAG: hypothetical protein F6K17_39225 [Okeania sp. SIO3C4]|nr:hypothetical protein [Okeania sp. SIO3C4]